MRFIWFGIWLSLGMVSLSASAQEAYVLKPEAIFDGDSDALIAGVLVRIENGKIAAVGPEAEVAVEGAEIIELPGATLLPGLIDAHSHVLLHPYDETSWNDQVLKESRSLRVARAVVHAEATLKAGFTTLRDLGSEGAAYADVGIRDAINQGIISGPRLLVAGRAIVATGSYGPKGFHPDFDVPLGAEPADGYDDLLRVVRDQIGKGADWVKVYADYRWGPNGEARPTFSVDELKLIVETAASSGRAVVAHAASAEAMERAILAGVETIEHGDGATDAVFALMAEHGVAWCPTLAAGEAISRYGGWVPGEGETPARIINKRETFQRALEAGVIICNGSDVGVFDHGDNAWEIELLVEYGLSPVQALKAATSVNADMLHLSDRIGRIRAGLDADLVAVRGNPLADIGALRDVQLVVKEGEIVHRIN